MHDVLVIGAGFAGLRAALELRRAGLDVRVLEARNRVGGRSKPVTVAGLTLDAGGQWLGLGHQRLAALARGYGVAEVPQYDTGKRVLDLDGQVKGYSGLIPALPLPAVLETGWTLWRLNRMARSLDPSAPWDAARAAEWDAQTLEDWMKRHVKRREARALIDIAARAILCSEPQQLSFLYFLHYIRASGTIDYLAEAARGAQAIRFDGGAHQLSVRMAQELGDRLVTDTPVERVTQDAGGVRVETRRGEWRCRRLVAAVSPAVLERIDFQPLLPAARLRLHRETHMGSVIKCHVAYARPFWREAGFSGEAVGDRDFGPVFDGGPADGSVGVLTGFFDGAPARRWHGRPQAERRAQVIECLVRWFGPQAAQPVDYADQDWRDEEWSGGCYTAVMPPGLLLGAGAALRQPFGAIHWAGTETAERWTGYFEGALLSGERAAREVSDALKEPAATGVPRLAAVG